MFTYLSCLGKLDHISILSPEHKSSKEGPQVLPRHVDLQVRNMNLQKKYLYIWRQVWDFSFLSNFNKAGMILTAAWTIMAFYCMYYNRTKLCQRFPIHFDKCPIIISNALDSVGKSISPKEGCLVHLIFTSRM